jgi:hypothetical protein
MDMFRGCVVEASMLRGPTPYAPAVIFPFSTSTIPAIGNAPNLEDEVVNALVHHDVAGCDLVRDLELVRVAR